MQDFSHIRHTPLPNWSALTDERELSQEEWEALRRVRSDGEAVLRCGMFCLLCRRCCLAMNKAEHHLCRRCGPLAWHCNLLCECTKGGRRPSVLNMAVLLSISFIYIYASASDIHPCTVAEGSDLHMTSQHVRFITVDTVNAVQVHPHAYLYYVNSGMSFCYGTRIPVNPALSVSSYQ